MHPRYTYCRKEGMTKERNYGKPNIMSPSFSSKIKSAITKQNRMLRGDIKKF